MIRQQIEKMFDSFFGKGTLSKAIKPDVVSFVNQCVSTNDEDGWIKSSEQLPKIGDRILMRDHGGVVWYGLYTDHNEFFAHMSEIREDLDLRERWCPYTMSTFPEWKPLQ